MVIYISKYRFSIFTSAISNNTVARIVKRPKIYMTDTGLSCYLAGYLDSLTLEKSAYNGAIFRNICNYRNIKIIF